MVSITDSMDRNLGEPWSIVKDWPAAVHRVTKIRHDLATEPQPQFTLSFSPVHMLRVYDLPKYSFRINIKSVDIEFFLISIYLFPIHQLNNDDHFLNLILIISFISFFLVNLATVSSILLIISKSQFDFTDLLYCFHVYNFIYLCFNFNYCFS